MNVQIPPNVTPVIFHNGETLLHLSNIYAGPAEMFQELLQNAVDTDVRATQIEIVVNLKAGEIAIRDNGLGTTMDKFQKALATVATPNRKGTDALGQFGIGLMSPLSKCERFSFTSRDKNDAKAPFFSWTFDSEKLKAIAGGLGIPYKRLDYLTNRQNAGRGFTTVWWTTEVRLFKINCSPALSKLSADIIIKDIQSRFGVVMSRNKVLLNVYFTDSDGLLVERENVRTNQFRGEPLKQVNYKLDNLGYANFKLHLVPFSTRATVGRGEILFGVAGKDIRIPAKSVFKTAENYLPPEVLAALQSGHLEGEIIGQNLKTKANRKSFEEDAAFLDLCVAIEGWFIEHGKKIVEEIKEDERANRYQALGLRSMTVIEKLLNLPENAHLNALVSTFTRGHIGSGHADVSDWRNTSETVKGLSTAGNPGMSKSFSGDHSKSKDRTPAKQEKPEHKPFAVSGPHGRDRKVVRGSSSGLMFCYEMMKGREIWDLDMAKGQLTFNICHPSWQVCEKTNSYLMKFQEIVAINALLLETMPEQQRSIQKSFVEHQIGVLVGWITSADKTRQESHPDLS